MYASSDNNLQIDRDQIAQLFKLLGYARDETVYIRAFHPSDDPRSKEDKGRKGDATTVELIAQAAEMFQSNGRGVYFVVNGGGQKDSDVKTCRAIFYEHDNLSKEVQRLLWKTLGLPEPTFQIDTGGKSIHSYWVFDKPISPTQWKPLQTDLLEFADADRSLKNPSRVMRLAGCHHISAKGTYPTLIVSASGVRYDYHQLREIITRTEKKSSPQLPLQKLQNIGSVPLTACLSRADRELVASGVGEGGRNSGGAKLARNLIGTESRLQELGIQHSGSARKLFDDYCNRCSPPLDMKEADQIWKKAQIKNPTATLSDDAIFNCVKAWQRRQQVPSTQKTVVNGVNDRIVELSLRDRIIEILQRGLKQSQEKQAFLELAINSHTPPREIDGLAKLLRRELEVEESRGDRQQEIEEFLEAKTKTKTLDLAHFLPAQIAEPVKLWCKWLNIRPEVALSAILAATSSLHPVETELVIHRSQEFSVPPNLFVAIVAESGQKKSPIFKTLIRKPLGRLQREANILYENDMKRYTAELAEWEKDPSNNSKPTKPGKPVFYFTDSTGEGIKAQAQECPDKALLGLVDEISGLFNSANQYRGGKGSDRQDMLSYFDGFGQTVLRASGIKVDVDRIYLTLFGGIQPKVLRELTRDLDDPDGQWARFLFASQPLAAAIMDDDGSGVNINELMAGCYRQVAALGKHEYTLSREAFKRYQKVYNHLEQKRVSHPQAGMRAIFSKMEGLIGRLALNLHAVSVAVNGTVNGVNDTEISIDTMNKAIELAGFYMSEIKAIHAESAAEGGELSALLAKLLDSAVTAGRLTSRDAIRKNNAIKTNSQALELFRELESCGYGSVEKIKQSWVFIPIKKSGDQKSVNGVRGSVRGGIDTSLSIYSNGSSDTVNGVNGVNDFSDFSSQSDTERDKEGFSTSTNKPTPPEKNAKIIDTPDTIDSMAETPTQSGVSTVNAPPDTTIDTSKNEDSFTNTDTLPDEPASLLQIEVDGGDISNFIGRQIEARFHSGDIKFTGEITKWDEKHGVITVATPEGARIAHIRECFIIC
jgi:hypothetical protein